MLQCLLGLLLLLASCSLGGPLRVDKTANAYTFPPPPAGWTKLPPAEGAEIIYKDASGAILSVSSLCERYEESTLAQLARSALSPIENMKELQAQPVQLDGREAYQVFAEGKVDGVPVQIDFIAWRKNDCLFDFSLQASPRLSANARTDFLAMVKKFHYGK